MAALAAGNALRNVDRGERQSVSLHRVGSCGRDRAGHRNHRDRRSAVARPGVARSRRRPPDRGSAALHLGRLRGRGIRPYGRLHVALTPPDGLCSWLRRKIEEGRMRLGLERLRLGAVLLAVLPALAGAAQSAETAKKPVVINPPPTAQDWADLAKLPDWSGVWNPKVTDQDPQG